MVGNCIRALLILGSGSEGAYSLLTVPYLLRGTGTALSRVCDGAGRGGWMTDYQL